MKEVQRSMDKKQLRNHATQMMSARTRNERRVPGSTHPAEAVEAAPPHHGVMAATTHTLFTRKVVTDVSGATPG
jgi:hypothetical protein